MSLMNLSEFTKRPGVGTKGQKIKVKANFFPIKKFTNNDIHHYDISIIPDLRKAGNLKVFKLLQASDFKGIVTVFDGVKNIFSPKELSFGDCKEISITAQDIYSKGDIKIIMKKVSTINLEELHMFLNGKISMSSNVLMAINCLDIAFRIDNILNKVAFGRSFYNPRSKKALSNGIEMWQGLYQSCRPGSKQLLLNADISHTAFYQSGPLYEVISSYLNKDLFDLKLPWNKNVKKDIVDFIKHASITLIHRKSNRKYKILDITEKDSKNTKFKYEDKEISIFDYFKSQHNMVLQSPTLPCVIISKNSFVPMELCEVLAGQRYGRKLNDIQTSEMIKITCTRPNDRQNKILQEVSNLKLEQNQYLKAFEINVDNQMMTVDARLLPPPTICFGKSSKLSHINPRDGKWNLKDIKVSDGKILENWTIISFGNSRDKTYIDGFVKVLISTCNLTGMIIKDHHPNIEFLNPQSDIQKGIAQTLNKIFTKTRKAPKLILIILPSTSASFYGDVKLATDVSVGTISQCVQMKHVRTAKVQYCANLCLKINAKIGGHSNIIKSNEISFITGEPTILMGADVTHPGIGEDMPSIATLVGSINSHANRYSAISKAQDSKVEIIQDLKNMVIEILKNFNACTKAIPKKILFYRDGVSEGQFSQVLETEFKAIKEACKTMGSTYNPPITFVIVQKRHHARFFPSDGNFDRKSGNCTPGTVVDSHVTHPFEFDFYLQSHAGLQGTARPAHYHVLKDENSFTADSLQDLTNRLCYTFMRSTTSVSLVPPVYYSHLAAFRARFHYKSAIHRQGANLKDLNSLLKPIHLDLKNEMYFI